MKRQLFCDVIIAQLRHYFILFHCYTSSIVTDNLLLLCFISYFSGWFLFYLYYLFSNVLFINVPNLYLTNILHSFL